MERPAGAQFVPAVPSWGGGWHNVRDNLEACEQGRRLIEWIAKL
jgi:hypothetical protein